VEEHGGQLPFDPGVAQVVAEGLGEGVPHATMTAPARQSSPGKIGIFRGFFPMADSASRVDPTEVRTMAGVTVNAGGKGGRKALDSEINMIPMIDLLMVTISFLPHHRVGGCT